MSCYKVEICGVNTAKLPLLSNEEKEQLILPDPERGYGCKRRIYQRKSTPGLKCDHRFAGSQENIR